MGRTLYVQQNCIILNNRNKVAIQAPQGPKTSEARMVCQSSGNSPSLEITPPPAVRVRGRISATPGTPFRAGTAAGKRTASYKQGRQDVRFS